jgi:hypothetical protein
MPVALYRRPLVGLLGLLVGFLTQPLGHTVYKLVVNGFGAYAVHVSVLMGIGGLLLIWNGLGKPELGATWRGMLGGWFLWMGWFEYSFKFYAELYGVPGFVVEADGYVAAPQANMLQATLPVMFALFLLYGMFNRETKCNFMRWFHRRLHFSPGMPTPGHQRSFARIAAMEILFVTWFCYLFWLYMIYFGTRGTGVQVIMGTYVLWTAWALYLVYKCTQQVRVAPSLRYGIGAGIVLWGTAEMPAHFGAYREYWLYPAEYPIFNAIIAAIFVTGLVLIARRPPVPREPAPAAQAS